MSINLFTQTVYKHTPNVNMNLMATTNFKLKKLKYFFNLEVYLKFNLKDIFDNLTIYSLGI